MKFFAILPEPRDRMDLRLLIQRLPSRGVQYVYTRPALPQVEREALIASATAIGMVPIVHYSFYKDHAHAACGVHVRSHETEALTGITGEACLVSAACHDAPTAESILLRKRADYVFVSPVYAPYSKPADNRALFPRRDVMRLVEQFGERVVLLGGMHRQRIRQLQQVLPGDFSVAGISMFFPEAARAATPDGPT